MEALIIEKFYSIFWADEACQEIFLLHKEHLLEKEEIGTLEKTKTKPFYYSARFVISNSLTKKDFASKLNQRVKNQEIELNHGLGSVGQRNFDQVKVEQYFKEVFAQPFNELSKKLDSTNTQQVKFIVEATTSLLSEKRFVKFLQKYKFIPATVQNLDEMAGHFEKLFKTEVDKIITPERVADFLLSLDHLTTYYHNAYVKSLMDADSFYTDVLYQKENYKSRIALFDILYEAGVLQGGKFKAYYECTSCNRGVFSASANINLIPSKLKIKCPACGDETLCIAPYEIQQDIFRQIIHKDGLLLHAIKYLLEKKGLKFTVNQKFLSDVEIDIAIGSPAHFIDLLEIKMYKTDRPEDTVQSNLETDLRKFLNSRRKLIESDPKFQNSNFHFITNYTDDSYYIDLAKTFNDEIKNQNVFLCSPMQFKLKHFREI